MEDCWVFQCYHIELYCILFFIAFYVIVETFLLHFAGEKTEKYIGVSEMLVGVSASGLIFSLLGGQPILIIGFTGPILVFEESLYQVLHLGCSVKRTLS